VATVRVRLEEARMLLLRSAAGDAFGLCCPATLGAGLDLVVRGAQRSQVRVGVVVIVDDVVHVRGRLPARASPRRPGAGVVVPLEDAAAYGGPVLRQAVSPG